jgi:uncharacterized protein YfaS (alpha-2-macroglobulin family)
MTNLKAVIAAVAVLIAGSALAESQSVSKDNATQPAFSLTLSAASAQVRTGESLRLIVSLKNIASKEIVIAKENATSDEADYRIYAVDEQGKNASSTPYYRVLKGERQTEVPKFVIRRSTQMLTVQPGESLESGIDLGRIYKTDTPGVYKIWVERLDKISNVLVKSNAITVTVTS